LTHESPESPIACNSFLERAPSKTSGELNHGGFAREAKPKHQTWNEEARKRGLVETASHDARDLHGLIHFLRSLFSDKYFVTLLRAEELNFAPKVLADRILRSELSGASTDKSNAEERGQSYRYDELMATLVPDFLTLTLARAHLATLLSNLNVRDFLVDHHANAFRFALQHMANCPFENRPQIDTMEAA